MPVIVVHHDPLLDAASLTTPMVAPLPPGTTMAEASGQSGQSPAKGAAAAGRSSGANRPDDSRWTQQRLRVWEPMLTLNWAILASLAVAASALALGAAILHTSASLTTLRVVYDDGGSGEAVAEQAGGSVSGLARCQLTAPEMANSFHADHTCLVTFTLPSNVTGPLHVFYELDQYFQHHRRFVSSMDRTQFTGEWTPDVALTACAPLETSDAPKCVAGACDASSGGKTRALYPCGIVATSMFNDIFWLHEGRLPTGETLTRTDLVSRGIARSYTAHNSQNPAWLDDERDDDYLPVWRNPNLSRLIPPPRRPSPGGPAPTAGHEVHITSDYTNSTAWVHAPLDPRLGVGAGVENEFWRVWVEGAAREPFRKPYARIERFAELPAGTTLTFAVQSNFYVRAFGGKKALVVGELGWFGSESVALGGVFVAIGGVFLAAGVLAAARKCQGARPLGDAAALAWKKQQRRKHKQQ